jgi:MFS family permease
LKRISTSNPLILLVTELPWSVTMAWMGSYLTIFLVQERLSPTHIGLALGIGSLLQVFGLAGSGVLSQHLGRKGSIMLGDFVGWVLVLGVWTLVKDPLWLAIGVVANQAGGFVGPAWNSLFSEGSPGDRLAGYFLVLQVMTIAGGLVLPFMAPLVRHVGVVVAGHAVLWVLWPMVALSWAIRLIGLKESNVGRASMAHARPRFKEVVGHIRIGLQGPGLILSGLRVLVQVPVVLFATFAPLALVARHGTNLPAHQLAFLPIAGALAAIGLGSLHTMGPHRSPRAMILLALILLLLGFVTLGTAPRHDLLVVMVGWMLVIAGQSQFWTSHTSYWMTSLPDLVRVEIQGWTGVVTASLVALLSPLIAGVYAARPGFILEASAGICLVAGLLATQLPKAQKSNAVTG